MRWLRFTLTSTVVVIAGVITALKFGDTHVRQLSAQVDELSREKARLVAYAERLSASRRVAQVHVVVQREDPQGGTVNTLLWQEIGADGVIGEPRLLKARGTLVYFEALVIKFEHVYVGQGDEQRGTSLAMFRRVFGDRQAPESVPDLDRSAPPAQWDSDVSAGHQAELWQRFWDLADDPHLAATYGVRVAQVEAPAVRLRAGQIWEVRLDAGGGLNLRKISEPLRRHAGGTEAVRSP